MTNLTFIVDIDKYSVEHLDEIHYKYHINTFDFPMVHSHEDYWEFTIVTDGTLFNIRNGKKETCREHTLFFSTTKDAHCLKRGAEGKLRYINIAVKESYLTKMLNVLSPSFKQTLLDGERACPFPVEYIYKIEELLHRVNLLTSKQLRLKNDLLHAATLLILQHLFSSHINLFDETLTGDFVWMQKLSVIMQKPEFPTYTVNDLCDGLGYSRMQLNRLFKQHLGKKPHEYLTDYKLRYAKSLLKNTDMKILDVAMASGYSTLSQFQLNFKRNFGVTPGAYRKQSKQLNDI
ncbi:MAG: helix-turn-helix transcriptional regulator [Clostridia bacterium]|nr:helix-turn-helix transcriptional regulator [Clostridia bacterium]